VSLLPAGSVCGAPKAKTLEIIRTAESEDRGYYTGVVGWFDGSKLDSGVMISYIEKQGDHFYYRSGGGITDQSELQKEYQELIDKIYVPVD
jgi:para-aminobenzoate synthetase component 1